MNRITLTILVGLIGWTAFGQFSLEQTITDPGSVINELFGYNVAVAGDFMVVGAPYANDRDLEAGMAYLYHFDGSSWNLASVLLPDDTVASHRFGYDVAIDEDVIAVSTNSNFNGKVYLFEKGGSVWSDTTYQALAISDPQSRWRFSFSVDIAGDFLVVGAPKVTAGGSQLGGEVYVYKKNSGDTWSQNSPTMVRRFFTGSSNGSIDGMGYDVKFMKDVDQLLIFNHSSINTLGTNGVIRFAGFSTYTSFANIDLGQSTWNQLIPSSSQFPGSQAGGNIQYANGVLLFDQKIYRLDNNGTYGSFNQEGSIAGNVITSSAGLSAEGDLITALIQDGNETHLVCYKKYTTGLWAIDIDHSKRIAVTDLPNSPNDPTAYVTLPVSTGIVKDYHVIVGLGEATSNGTTNAGVIKAYDLDISPQVVSFFPSGGASGIKFQSDTTLNILFDCNVQPTSNAQMQYLTSFSLQGIINLATSAVVDGHQVKVPLAKSIWSRDYMNLTYFTSGSMTDAYGLTVTLPSVSSSFQLGNIAPPTFTTTFTNVENQFARGTFTVDLQANDGIDTVAGNTIQLINASIGSISRVSNQKFQFDVTPNFTIGNPDMLNQLTVKIPNTFFTDTAGNVAQDSIIIKVDYSQSIVRKDGTWLDGVPGNTYPPVATDNVFIAEDYTTTNTNLTMNNLIIGDNIVVILEGEVEMDIHGGMFCEGSLYVKDSATVFFRKDFDSGDSIFVRSGASLYTFDGFNHVGKIHAERKNSFGVGKYSFVGTPFVETETNDTDAFGSYVYAYDPTQAFGADGLSQWVDASAQTIIPGKGYTSSSTDTLKLSGTPNTGTVEVINLKYDPNASSNPANLGWQLLSNPFLAPLRVDEMWAGNQAALEVEAIYLWDDGGSDQGQRTASDYLVYNSMGAVGGANAKTFNGMLMPFQAFMVKLTDSIGGGRAAPRIDRSFVFEETMRATSGGISGNFFRKNQLSKVRLKVSDQDGIWSETLIGFADDASNGFDSKYDAYFRSGKELGVFSLLDESKLAIQGFPLAALSKPVSIPIGLSSSGYLTFSITELQGLSHVNISLINNRSGESVRLKLGDSHTLYIQGELNTDYSILFEPLEILGSRDAEFNHLIVLGEYGNLSVRAPSLSGFHEVQIHDLSGRIIFSKQVLFKQGEALIRADLKVNQVYILKAVNQSIKFLLN